MIELALEPLLHDLHVQEAEEAAAEAEAQRDRRFRLEEERGVVEPQLLERVAQLRVLAAFDRVHAGEDHGLDFLEPGERLRRRPRRFGDGVADLRVGDGLDAANTKPTSPTPSDSATVGFGRERADLLDLVLLALRHQLDLHAPAR